MSDQDSIIDIEEQAAFFVPPSHQPPSKQNNNNNNNINNTDTSDDGYSSDDRESNEITDEEDNSSSDDDYDDEKDEELFPEKPWARRCVDRIRNSQEYLDLSKRWRLIRSSVEAGIEVKSMLDELETKEVLPFVNRELLFFTELVVQAYIQDALAVVGVGHRNPALRPPGANRLPQAVLEGRRGLCWQTFYTLLNGDNDVPARDRQPDVKCPRPHPVRNTKNGDLNLAGRYKKKDDKYPTWADKLQELFAIDDDEVESEEARKQIRDWDTRATFRQKTRRLIQFLKNSFSDDGQLANYWKQNLARMASRYLWAVPYFEKSSLGKPASFKQSRGYQTIAIIVPATYRQGFLQQQARVRERERDLKVEVKEWLESQPKVEDSEDGYDRRYAILAAIQNEKTIVDALRGEENPIDPSTRNRLLKKVQEVFCHNVRLFSDLQYKASVDRGNIRPVGKIRLDPTVGFNSRRGANTIGLQGRNRESMIKHVRALHPILSEDEADRAVQRVVNQVKNSVSTFGYVERHYEPRVSISPRRRRVNECECRGVPLFAVFGDALHLTAIDEYMASLPTRQRPRQDDDNSPGGQGAAKRRRVSRGGSNRGHSIVSVATTAQDSEAREEATRSGSDLGVENTEAEAEMEGKEDRGNKRQQSVVDHSLSGIGFI